MTPTGKSEEALPEVVALFACDDRGGIGRRGKLPWRFPADLVRFKGLTQGNPVIMGRLTFQSLPRALPGRLNIVLSRTGAELEGAVSATSPEMAMALCEGSRRVSIIGGSSIYTLFADRIDRYEITRIPGDYDCDVFVDVDSLINGFKPAGRVEATDRLVFETYRRQ